MGRHHSLAPNANQMARCYRVVGLGGRLIDSAKTLGIHLPTHPCSAEASFSLPLLPREEKVD